jgi:2-oxoglutarate dehydrogenase complex dehydrogenase (E1) component-like enzyme
LEKLDEYFQLMDEKRSSTSGEERKEAMQKMSTIEAFEEFLEKQ